MEFVIGYLIGAGANWETFLVTIVACVAISVIWDRIFGPT